MQTKIAVTISLAAVALAISAATLRRAAAADEDGKSAITKFENDEVKADLAGDKSFYGKNLASDWSGGDSSGKWFGKTDVLKMLDDPKNNKYNSEKLSDMKVRTYGDTAIATYKDTYDAFVEGEHRVRTVISTDTFAKQGGVWKEVASHSSTAAK